MAWDVFEHAIAAATRARACKENDAAMNLAVALAPAAVVFRNRRAAAHCVLCASWMLFWRRARARSRFFAVRRLSADVSRLLLASAAPAGPRRRRQENSYKGQPRLGAKHSGRFPTSAAARGASLSLVWEC